MGNHWEKYQKTASFWDKVFDRLPDFDPEEPLPSIEIENALGWLAEGDPRVLDFGCGHGRVLFRAQKHGAREGIGIDVSRNAVEKGRAMVNKFGLEEKISLVQGGIPELKKFQDESFEGIIIFNVLDNLLPDHGKLFLSEAKRLLAPEGKMLIKLNPFLEAEDIKEAMQDAVAVQANLFLQQNGIYFWNIRSEEVREMAEPELHIEKEKEIDQGENAPQNRLFFLRKIN